MRIALASLIVLAGLAPSAFAQTPAPTDAAPPAPAPTPMVAPPAAAPSPAPTPSGPAAPVAPPTTPDATAPASVAPVPEAAPAAPPAPPPAPTDPTAIGLLSVLENVCIPAANGGNMGALTKAAGFRKSGDNYVLKRPTFQFTVLAPGANPNVCHVDIVHPVDPEAPAKPLVVALHNWAAVSHGWSLIRNDKNTDSGLELTTRSWENSADGKSEGLVLTTYRKADGSPSLRGADTSTLLYSVTKTGG